MIRLINRLTGTDMYVDESRVDKYIAEGHKRPSETVETVEKKKRTTKKK